MRFYMNVTIFLTSLLVSTLCLAKVHRLSKAPEMIANLLEKELHKIDGGLNNLPSTRETNIVAASDSKDIGFYFHRFKIRLEPFIEFGVSSLMELKVYPILEIEVIRDPPAGWELYKPASLKANHS